MWKDVLAMVCTEQVRNETRAAADPRRAALVESLRRRYAEAEGRQDAAAKQALFKEGAYLNIPPAEFVECR
jgi:hypothetical protein